MSPVDREIIKRKLAVITRNLNALQRISGLTRHEYESDVFLKKGTERLLQELIEAAIDINTHIIVELGGVVPDTYFDAFLQLGVLRVLPDNLAHSLAPSAGLRNRLVHDMMLSTTRLSSLPSTTPQSSLLNTSVRSKIS